jgi:protein PsiE
MIDVYKVITVTEKLILILIAIFTVYGVGVEMYTVISSGAIIFIAITALCRLIILQGKGISSIDLIYESAAVVLLALAALIIRWNLIKLVRDPGDEDDH